MEGIKRTVRIVQIQSQEVTTIETPARTWGELKSMHPEVELMSRGANAWLKEGKVDLTRDSQELPGGEVIIYLYVDKMKAGTTEAEITEFVESLPKEEQEEACEILKAITEVVDYSLEGFRS